MRSVLVLALAVCAQGAAAQTVAGLAASTRAPAGNPVTVESYYRAKWGSAEEFKKLYRKNEASMLIEMQRQGFIKELRFDEPFTHIPGDNRWDIRATIVYRDAPAAVELGGAWDEAWEATSKRLRPDKKVLDAEEKRRFELLEDHWDIIVSSFDPKPSSP